MPNESKESSTPSTTTEAESPSLYEVFYDFVCNDESPIGPVTPETSTTVAAHGAEQAIRAVRDHELGVEWDDGDDHFRVTGVRIYEVKHIKAIDLIA